MSKEDKKPAAKRLGVGSVLRYGGENLAITTFGCDNEANIAVKTDIFGSALNLPHSTDRFAMSDFEESEIDIERGDLESLLENPRAEFVFPSTTQIISNRTLRQAVRGFDQNGLCVAWI